MFKRGIILIIILLITVNYTYADCICDDKGCNGCADAADKLTNGYSDYLSDNDWQTIDNDIIATHLQDNSGDMGKVPRDKLGEVVNELKDDSELLEALRIDSATIDSIVQYLESEPFDTFLEDGKVSDIAQQNAPSEAWYDGDQNNIPLASNPTRLWSESPNFGDAWRKAYPDYPRVSVQSLPTVSTSSFDGETLTWETPTGTSTIDLSSLSEEDTLTFLESGHILVNDQIFLAGSDNIHRVGDMIIADTINQGNSTFSIGIDGYNIYFDSDFSDVESAYFFENGYAFQTVSELTITKRNEAGESLTYIITDAGNISFDGINLTITNADSVIIGDQIIAANADKILIPFNYNYTIFDFFISVDKYQEIRVTQSDFIKIGQRNFENITNSRFVIDKDTIIYANVSSFSDITYYFDNPIQPEIDVSVTINKYEQFDYVNFNQTLMLQTSDVLESTVGEHYSTPVEYKSYGTETLVGTTPNTITLRPVLNQIVIYNGSLILSITKNCSAFTNESGGYLITKTDIYPFYEYEDADYQVLSTNISITAEDSQLIINDEAVPFSIYNIYGNVEKKIKCSVA